MNIQECGNCRFYHREEERRHEMETDAALHPDDYESTCRRYPPARGDADYFGHLSGMSLLRDAYSGPTVNIRAWCGEWAPFAEHKAEAAR